MQRVKAWVTEKPGTSAGVLSPSSSTAQLVGLGLTMSAVTAPGTMPDAGPSNGAPLSSSQRKRIKQYLKRCRMNPRHSQLNLEGYLLLPVQRIPRYRLLVSSLLLCTKLISDSNMLSSWRNLSGYAHLHPYTIMWKIRLTERWPKSRRWLLR